MARKKSHQVRAPKQDTRLIAGVITSDDMRGMQKAGRRQALKEAGMLGPRSGAGVHGGDKKKSARQERRDWKQRVNRGEV